MLRINCKQVLYNFKGEALKNGEVDLTIGEAISSVLGGQVSNPTLGWVLGKKFATEETVELKAEEVVFLKKEMTDQKHWLALVSGQIMDILDGNTVPSAKVVE